MEYKELYEIMSFEFEEKEIKDKMKAITDSLEIITIPVSPKTDREPIRFAVGYTSRFALNLAKDNVECLCLLYEHLTDKLGILSREVEYILRDYAKLSDRYYGIAKYVPKNIKRVHLCVKKHEDGIMVGEIVKEIKQSKASITRALKYLSVKGYIIRVGNKYMPPNSLYHPDRR